METILPFEKKAAAEKSRATADRESGDRPEDRETRKGANRSIFHSPPQQVSLGQRYSAFSGAQGSGRQNLAAFGTAARKNLAAIGGSHSLAEAMHFGSVALLG